MSTTEKTTILAYLQEIDRKLELLLTKTHVSSDDLRLLHTLTTKQHVTLQMIVIGASNRDIADKLGVTENTGKVHVRGLAAKLGVSTRAQITARMLPVLNDMGEDEYLKASGGLPKDWAERYRDADEDPYRTLYRNPR